MCLYPKLVRNPKYKPNKKNGGIIPPIFDTRILHVPIGCQNCMECRKQKTNHWRIRLLEDIKTNTNAKFISLTLSNESFKKIHDKINHDKSLEGYTLDNQIITYATRHFLENWRKEFKKSLRHFFISELGHNGTNNVHLHGFVWTNETNETIKRKWKYGFIHIGTYVNERSINYMCKYFTKVDFQHKQYKPIILTSPGIGNTYTKNPQSKYDKLNENYRTRTGHKMGLPIYFRNKLYTEEERELLWIKKLDKMERWVNGIKIDISQSLQPYYNALKYARQKNKELGYGHNIDKYNLERKEYEEKIRKIHHQTRLNNANTKLKPLIDGPNHKNITSLVILPPVPLGPQTTRGPKEPDVIHSSKGWGGWVPAHHWEN